MYEAGWINETTLLSYPRTNATTENMICFHFKNYIIFKIV